MSDTYKVVGAAALVIPTSGNATLLYRNSPVPADAVNLDTLLTSGMVAKIEEDDTPAGGHPSDLRPEYVAPVFKPGDGTVGVDYESLNVKALDAEIKRRNEGREDTDLVKPDGTKKAELIAALKLDDELAAAPAVETPAAE